MNIFNKCSTNKPFQFLLARHGESLWNKENRFTGWTDVPLTRRGRFQAAMIGRTLKYTNDISPRRIFTSELGRAVETSELIRANMEVKYTDNISYGVEVNRTWRLNEKSYGDGEGVCRNDLTKLFGNNYTRELRHSFFMRPPILESHQKYIQHDYIMKTCEQYFKNDLHTGESVEMVTHRMLPYWYDTIVPSIMSGDCPFIVTHRHNARAIIKYLSRMNLVDFDKLDIPNATIYHIKLNNELFIENFIRDVVRIDEFRD